MENPIYLGDGVYATFDSGFAGGGITLTTGTHEEAEADNVIYLEPEEAQALVNWLGQHGIRGKECK